MDKFELKKYLYYGLVGVISFIILVFLPMLGSETDIGFKFPNTTSGWFIYICSKLLVSVMNVLIFYCFMEQAKVNIKDDPHFKEANEILQKILDKKYLPRSPKVWNTQQYSTKAVSIFITTLMSAFVFTNAILTYDWVTFLTYIFTLIFGLVFGVLQMKSAEKYWTNEYWQYAIMRKDEIDKNKDKIKRSDIEKCLQSVIKNIETWKNKS